MTTTRKKTTESTENEGFFEAIEKNQVKPITPEIGKSYWIRIGYPYSGDTVHKAACVAINKDTKIAIFTVRLRRTQVFKSRIELYWTNIVAEIGDKF